MARRAGETAAADMHTPAATRADLFGAVDASTFEGLGLATTLSDHLEGDLADLDVLGWVPHLVKTRLLTRR